MQKLDLTNTTNFEWENLLSKLELNLSIDDGKFLESYFVEHECGFEFTSDREWFEAAKAELVPVWRYIDKFKIDLGEHHASSNTFHQLMWRLVPDAKIPIETQSLRYLFRVNFIWCTNNEKRFKDSEVTEITPLQFFGGAKIEVSSSNIDVHEKALAILQHVGITTDLGLSNARFLFIAEDKTFQYTCDRETFDQHPFIEVQIPWD